MKKLNFIQSRKDAQWAFQLNDGRIFEILAKNETELTIRYDTPINLTTGEIGEQPKYEPFTSQQQTIPEGFTTLNELIKGNKGKTVYCYDEYDINLKYPKTMTIKRAIRLAKQFKEHGFNVSSCAIMHNFEAWKAGGKSGYRDEERGTHLFTPCGGNPLSFRATTLENNCRYWQETYIG